MIPAAEHSAHPTALSAPDVTNRYMDLREGSAFEVVPHAGLLVARRKNPLSDHAEAEEFLAAHTLDRRLGIFNASRIPTVFARASITHHQADRQTTPALHHAVGWLNDWLAQADPFSSESKGMILSGPHGIGKSFALAAILRFLSLRLAMTTWFVPFTQLLHDFKASYQGDGDEPQLWHRLRTVQVLGLDDLASGRPSDWSKDILQSIIAFRYNSCSTTLLTTGLPLEPTSPSDTRPTLRTWVGAHCFSRFREMCTFMPVGGSDLRRNVLPLHHAVTAFFPNGIHPPHLPATCSPSPARLEHK